MEEDDSYITRNEASHLNNTQQYNAKSYNTVHNNSSGHATITWFQYIITRITFVLFFLGDLLMLPLVQQYILYRTALMYNRTDFATVQSQNDLCMNESREEAVEEMWTEIEKSAASTSMYYNIFELLPTVPAVFVLSAYGGATERRTLCLLLPCFGNFICGGLFLIDYYTQMNNFFLLYGGALIAGVTGGSVTFFSGGAALIADTVSSNGRTIELSMLESSMAIGLGCSNIITGYWIDDGGFEGPICFLFAIVALALTACLCIREPINIEIEVSFAEVWNKVILGCKVVYSSRYFSSILLYILAFAVVSFVYYGLDRTNVLYLETAPLCLSNILIGWWLFTQGTLMALGMLLLTCIKCLPDLYMTYAGLLSRILGSLILAFANYVAVAFAALPFLIFQLLPLAVLRSATSKLVSREEYGLLFGIMQCFQSIPIFLGPLVMNVIFSETLELFHGAVYIISVVFMIIPFILIRCARKIENTYVAKGLISRQAIEEA